MGSGSYIDFFWDKAAGLLLIDVARSYRSATALLGYRVEARAGTGEHGTLAVIPFRNDGGAAPNYGVVSLPDADDLVVSVMPIIDKDRTYGQDSALFDSVVLTATAAGPADRTVWSISIDQCNGGGVADTDPYLDIRDHGQPPHGQPISNLYVSQRQGVALHPAASLTASSRAHRLQVEVEHRFDPDLLEDLYDVIVSADPNGPPSVPILVNLETILAAEGACQYLEQGPALRQAWSLNKQAKTWQPGQDELRFTIPGPPVEVDQHQRLGNSLGFLDRILIWTQPAAMLEFLTHDRRTTPRHDDGLLLLVSLGGPYLQQDQGQLRTILQEVTGASIGSGRDPWFQNTPSLRSLLGGTLGIDCTAITEFAYATCSQDILAKVGGIAAGRLGPASLLAYLEAAPLYELLRDGDFAAVAAGLWLAPDSVGDPAAMAAFLFDLASARLRDQIRPDPTDQLAAASHARDDEIIDLWLDAFRSTHWELVELALHANTATAMRLGLLPDSNDFSTFNSAIIDHHDAAERYQQARARIEVWDQKAVIDLPALVRCTQVQSLMSRACQLEAQLAGTIAAVAERLGVSAGAHLAGGLLPADTTNGASTGETAAAARVLFERQAADIIPPDVCNRQRSDGSFHRTLAEFLVAMIADDCAHIDRAVASFGLINPALEDVHRAPSFAGLEEAGGPPYRVRTGRPDPDLDTWLKESTSHHRIIDEWRQRLVQQLA